MMKVNTRTQLFKPEVFKVFQPCLFTTLGSSQVVNDGKKLLLNTRNFINLNVY